MFKYWKKKREMYFDLIYRRFELLYQSVREQSRLKEGFVQNVLMNLELIEEELNLLPFEMTVPLRNDIDNLRLQMATFVWEEPEITNMWDHIPNKFYYAVRDSDFVEVFAEVIKDDPEGEGEANLLGFVYGVRTRKGEDRQEFIFHTSDDGMLKSFRANERRVKNLNAVIAFVDLVIGSLAPTRKLFVDIATDIEIEGFNVPAGFAVLRRPWHSTEPQYWVTEENAIHHVCCFIEIKELKDVIVHSFATKKEAETVKDGLNDGYSYSNEYGLECYMEQIERSYNS
ncbi:hypothetical protein A8L34_27760 [Bacillus sp. FJAT-27264]|uniref:hypothetical protein n=1 Tax=Paenibacillus sp. (strain DSM 101736 / FJAT-27264) TaxID=1850362 RepID=UPI0008080D2D|nr:hypothetical protein [Bacillus sp. FJAT-27264]OBZ15847.1 hypothetical protein A8L34_27760 [Bacillus sp. FJAT-27264]